MSDEHVRHARRQFLKLVAGSAAVTLVRPGVARAQAPQTVMSLAWKDQIGFELFTVASLYMRDPDGTFAALKAMGIRELQPRTYAGLNPTQFRALLDRHQMTCHSTHEFSIPGPGLEKDLEGLQLMGIKYARFPLPGVPIPGAGRAAGGAGGGGNRAAGAGRGAAAADEGAPAARGGRGAATMVETPEFMKRVAEDLNQNGRLAKKFGIKALYHNHTTEFQRYPNEPLLPYEILIKETDPDVVAMEIDIGWAAIAGQDIGQLFKAHPGRFELWHIKDAIGIRHLTPTMNQLERRANVTLVPVGLGEVDYKQIFTLAATAGLKHFYIEQDNAAAWGDAMAATRVSVENMKRMLS